jgi:hypothetical protein
MQGQFTPQQIITFRGGDCLLFRVVHPFSQKHRETRLQSSLRANRHSDLVLDAVIPSSVFSILFSQTIPDRCSQAPHSKHSQPWPWSARIVALCTTTFLDCSCPWRTFVDDKSTILTSQQVQELTGKIELRLPVNQEYIMANKDRVSLVFLQWRDRIKTKSAWQTPLALFISMALTFATSSFRDFSWISAGTLKGAFLFGLVGSGAWLIAETVRLIKSPSDSPEDFIKCLAEGTKKLDDATG